MNTVPFAVFVYIVIVAVIILAGNLSTAAAIMALIANMFILSLVLNKHHEKNGLVALDEKLSDNTKPVPKIEPPAQADNDPYYPYDKRFMKWDSYNLPMPSPMYNPNNVRDISCVGTGTMTVDDATVSITQARARDRRCSEGWASKDANFYKYHYGDELNRTESLPWWSQDEI